MPTLDDAISFVSWHAQCDWDPANDPPPDACVWEAKRFLELSLTYGATFQEIYSMLRVVTFGPNANNRDFVDPRLELLQLRCQMEQDAEFLRNNSELTLEQAVAIWRTAHRYNELLAEHHPSPEVRARYAEELRVREEAMRVASRGRIAP